MKNCYQDKYSCLDGYHVVDWQTKRYPRVSDGYYRTWLKLHRTAETKYNDINYPPLNTAERPLSELNVTEKFRLIKFFGYSNIHENIITKY
jgi:hypothetical protein